MITVINNNVNSTYAVNSYVVDTKSELNSSIIFQTMPGTIAYVKDEKTNYIKRPQNIWEKVPEAGTSGGGSSTEIDSEMIKSLITQYFSNNPNEIVSNPELEEILENKTLTEIDVNDIINEVKNDSNN